MHLYTDKKDSFFKYWHNMHYQAMKDEIGMNPPPVNRDPNKAIGFFMPTFNCRQLAEGSYHSLVQSMPHNWPFGFIALDTGSTDGTVEFFKGQAPVFGNHDSNFPYKVRGLKPVDCPPNVAIELWLGKYNKDTDTFDNEDRVKYICWIHSDMDFIQKGWAEKMIEVYESDPKIGILAPLTIVGSEAKTEYRGNAAPVFMSVKMIKRFYKKYGWFLDPHYAWCVGYDDWDMHFRCLELGYKSIVTPKARVNHYTGGTRIAVAKARTEIWNQENILNVQRYVERWGILKSPFMNDPHTAMPDNYIIPRTGQLIKFSDWEYNPDV